MALSFTGLEILVLCRFFPSPTTVKMGLDLDGVKKAGLGNIPPMELVLAAYVVPKSQCEQPHSDPVEALQIFLISSGE